MGSVSGVNKKPYLAMLTMGSVVLSQRPLTPEGSAYLTSSLIMPQQGAVPTTNYWRYPSTLIAKHLFVWAGMWSRLSESDRARVPFSLPRQIFPLEPSDALPSLLPLVNGQLSTAVVYTLLPLLQDQECHPTCVPASGVPKHGHRTPGHGVRERVVDLGSTSPSSSRDPALL